MKKSVNTLKLFISFVSPWIQPNLLLHPYSRLHQGVTIFWIQESVWNVPVRLMLCNTTFNGYVKDRTSFVPYLQTTVKRIREEVDEVLGEGEWYKGKV